MSNSLKKEDYFTLIINELFFNASFYKQLEDLVHLKPKMMYPLHPSLNYLDLRTCLYISCIKSLPTPVCNPVHSDIF